MTNALGAQSLDDPIGIRAQLVGHHDDAAQVTIDADEHVRLPGAPAAHDGDGGDLVGRDAGGAHEHAAAHRHDVIADPAFYPLAGLLAHIPRLAEREVGLDGRPDEGLAEHMRRHPVDGRRELQELPRFHPVAGEDVANVRRTDREGPGLVEQDRTRLSERLDRPGP